MRSITVGILVMAAAGCAGPFDGPLVCTDQLNSTLALRILNATTGAREGTGSTVIVRGSAVYDSVTVVPQFSGFDYLAFEDRIGAGTYNVTVRKQGFESQSFPAAVAADGCHAGPGPHMDVRLVPSP